MEQLTGITELDNVLSRLASIQSRDEHDEVMEELFKIAPNYVEPIHELYDLGTYQNMSLIWCLIGQTSEQAMALFSRAIKDKDQYTRWAAAKALSEFRTREASQLLVAALKDRSHLLSSLQWMRCRSFVIRALCPS